MSYTATARISLLQLFKLRGFQLLSFPVPQAVTWLIHMVYVQMYIKSKSHSLEQSRMTVMSHAKEHQPNHAMMEMASSLRIYYR